ncbi:MAG: hypothetical protein KAU35_00150 [candidate division Zixibacteria bacterium]|nr:hypothetical protein [candidate division Zixibacteria bacterium]
MLQELEQIVGKQMYAAFIRMLQKIGPEARTQRISVVIAAMLIYALDQLPADCEEGTLGEALLEVAEETYLIQEISKEYDTLYQLIDSLCTEAGMRNERENYQGVLYSIAENAIAEYVSWYNMPWEN